MARNQQRKNLQLSHLFVSYSYQDAPQANHFIDILKSMSSDIQIHVSCQDQEEDHQSQQMRYQAVELSQCLVAFLTPDYLKSRTCIEEFNIALAKQLSHNAFYLLPIYTGAIDHIPRSLSTVPSVDVCGAEPQLETLAQIVADILKQSKAVLEDPNVKLLKGKLEDKRTSEFTDKFRLEGGNITWNPSASTLDYGKKGHVILLCAQDCLIFAVILSVILKQHAWELSIELQSPDCSQNDLHLTPADLMIVFVSDQFASSSMLKTELHKAFYRQQLIPDRSVIYFIESQHHASDPLYLYSLPFSVSLDDKLWRRLERACSNRNPRYTANLKNIQGQYRCTAAQNLALTAAAFDAIHMLCHGGGRPTSATNIISLAKLDHDMKGWRDDMVSVHEYIISLDSLNRMVARRASSSSNDRFSETSSLTPPCPDSLASHHKPEVRRNDLKDDNIDGQINQVSITQKTQASCQGTVNLESTAEILSHHDMEDIKTMSENAAEGHLSDPTQTGSRISSRTSLTSETTMSSTLTSISDSPSSDTRAYPTRQFSVTCQII